MDRLDDGPTGAGSDVVGQRPSRPARDPIWALGDPNATDICLRCHVPEGWLGGRSDPPNGTLMSGSDFDGVHCDVCHRMWDPFSGGSFDGADDRPISSDYGENALGAGFR